MSTVIIATSMSEEPMRVAPAVSYLPFIKAILVRLMLSELLNYFYNNAQIVVFAISCQTASKLGSFPRQRSFATSAL